MKLGTLLLRDAVITLNQLEAALRTQVLYGGRLGTNLVELGFLDVDTLGGYLGSVLGVPVATKEAFEAADSAVVSAFGAELADLYSAFPLRYEGEDDTVLAVAMVDPRDDRAIEQLGVQCNSTIQPYAAAELRVLYYLERHYGLERRARFVRSGSDTDGADLSWDERRRTQAPRGMELPGTVTFSPRKKIEENDDAEEQAGDAKPPLGYPEACDAIDAADHRNHIADALIEFATGRFEVCAVFIIRDVNALGWRAYSSLGITPRGAVEKLGLPLGGASILQAAFDSRTPYRGSSPAAGRPIEARLWEALGRETPPPEMLCVPILVRRRVVNLVYVHGFGDALIDDQHADELAELSVRASDAYVRLIQGAKSSARADTQS